MINPYAQTFLIATRMEPRPVDRIKPSAPRPGRLRRLFSRAKPDAAK